MWGSRMKSHHRRATRPIVRSVSAGLLIIIAGVVTGCDSFLLGTLLDGETARPDYVIDLLSRTSGTVAGQQVTGEFIVTNAGEGNGSHDLDWNIYASLHSSFDAADDHLVDQGSHPAMNTGVTSDVIEFQGFWPADPDTYYLIVVVVATPDDPFVSNNELADSGTAVTSPPLVDYAVTLVSRTFTAVSTSSAISEIFTYRNAGSTAGTVAVDYTVYASSSPTWDIDDDVVGGDSLGAGSWLGAGASSAEMPISAFWPATAGTWYLTVEVNSTEESYDLNDRLTVGPFMVNDPPDYTVSVPAFPAIDYGGNPTELISTASSDHGGSPLHQIQITEIDSSSGLQDITWKIHQSDDPFLDGLDLQVAGGTIPRLVADGSTVIDVDFSLPGSWGYWYYIVTISAGDDSDISSNTATVGPVHVWQAIGNAESDTDEDDILVTDADDFAVLLNPGDNVVLSGLIDQITMRDSFLIYTGQATTEFQIRATWVSAPDEDNLNLFVYDESDLIVDSSTDSGLVNEEPNGGGYWTLPGLTPSSFYYIEAVSLAPGGDVGNDFTIEVLAGP